MIGFREWLQKEMLSPVQFPTTSPDRNPYMNCKWSTCAFPTGKAKVKKNVVRDAENGKKSNTKQDGYHL